MLRATKVLFAPNNPSRAQASVSRLIPLNELSKSSRRYALVLMDALRLALDGAAALLGGWLAFILYYGPSEFPVANTMVAFFQAPEDQYAKLSVLAGLVFALMTFFKYGRAPTMMMDGVLQRIMSVWCLTLLFVIGILFLMKTGSNFSRGWMMIWALITPMLLIIARYVERSIIFTVRQAGFARQRIAIVGTTSQAVRLLERLRQHDFRHAFDIVGVFDDDHVDYARHFNNVRQLGTISDLRKICDREHLDAVVIAVSGAETAYIKSLVARLMDLPSNILLGPDLAHFDLSSRPSAQLGVLPAETLTRLPMRDWAGLGKWLEDKLIVIAAAIFLAPLLLLVAFLIKIDSAGPVLFRQKRFGFNNVEFDVYKFRTMYVSKADPTGGKQTTRHDRRVTRVGRFLRRTSIDELPQLINVWQGHMSIVGPAPIPLACWLIISHIKRLFVITQPVTG